MKYLLLTKHATRSGDRTDWEMFSTEIEAKEKLKILKKQSSQYESMPFMGPVLVQSTIVKVEEVE